MKMLAIRKNLLMTKILATKKSMVIEKGGNWKC
jgi:hypothetical protein